MKTISSGLQTHIEQRITTLAFCLKVTASDGTVIAMTEHSRALTVGGTTYQPGLTVGSLASTCGLEVDNTEFTLIPDDDPIITTADLMGGKWDGAEVSIDQVNWATPGDGVIGYKRGHVGNIRPELGAVVMEFRDLRQALRTDTSAVFQPNCRYRLGDAKCTVDLEPFTFDGEVTSTASVRQVTDSSLAQAADYFTEGELTWVTGENTGRSVKIKSHTTGGVLNLAEPMLLAIGVGDTFTVVAGCMKRLADCRDKYDNVLNFGGEPHKPEVEDVVRSPS